MDFLAHAFVLPDLAPDLVLGAALPDLLGAFDRRAPRLGPDAAEALAASGHAPLARGVRAHHAADVCFHALPAFTEACRALKPLAIRVNESGGCVRGFFLTHLLVELLIDRALVARAPGLADSFYSAIARADRARALSAARDPAAFTRFVDRFVEARFLVLHDPASLATRLGRIVERARQTLGPGRAALEAGIDEASEVVAARLDELVEPPREAVRRAL